jgi:anthranilate synthase/aminodeoxychorismate synthase-like glutamine amidotransferase
MLDNYDSFTYNLVDYLQSLGAEIQVIRNDELSLSELSKTPWKGIVLSPGPGKPAESGILMEVIAHYSGKIPILGICLGHQAIGQYYGAQLYPSIFPMHGKVSQIQHKGHPMFSHCPKQFSVCRYHSLAIGSLENTELEETAWCIDPLNGRVCMALVHKSLPLWSVQYHPEAILTEHGKTLLNNWLNVFNLR